MVCGCSVIDLATCISDSLGFRVFTRLVIKTQRVSFFAFLTGEDSSRVTNISNVANVLDNKHNDGTGPTFICEGICLRIVSFVDKGILCLLESLYYSFFRVGWEARLLNHVKVKVIPEEISTLAASMAIVDTEI